MTVPLLPATVTQKRDATRVFTAIGLQLTVETVVSSDKNAANLLCMAPASLAFKTPVRIVQPSNLSEYYCCIPCQGPLHKDQVSGEPE